MKKNLFVVAVGSLVALPGAALADAKIYGRFNVGLDGQKDEIGLDSKETSTTWRVQDQNNSSRLGFKGSQDIGLADMSVIYQLEYARRVSKIRFLRSFSRKGSVNSVPDSSRMMKVSSV